MQRFYHQQNQLREREREREKHELKYQTQNELNTAVNPFLNSFIPKYHPSHQIPSQIPIHHQQQQPHQFSSQINQSDSSSSTTTATISNDNHYNPSNIPVYSQHSNAKKQFLFNCNRSSMEQQRDRPIETTSKTTTQQQYPAQLDGNYVTGTSNSGYPTAHNNYSKNVYGRTMITQPKTSQPTRTTSNDGTPNMYKDEG